MAKRGKPRKEGASGRHDFTEDESLAFWRGRWRAEFEALPPAKQAEQREHLQRLLAKAPARSPLRSYAAAACGIEEDDDGGICHGERSHADLPDHGHRLHADLVAD